MRARAWAACLVGTWGLGPAAAASSRIDIELRDKTIDGVLRCTVTQASPADKGLWSEYQPHGVPPSFEWRLSSYCTASTLPAGKTKHEVRVFEFKATNACDNPPWEPPFPYPLSAASGPSLVDYLNPAPAGATQPVLGILGGDAAQSIPIEPFEEHCWAYSMRVDGLKPIDPELRLKGSGGLAPGGLRRLGRLDGGPEVMAEVRLKETVGKDGKKRCVVDHKPASIDVAYRLDQPPSVAWRVKNYCGAETGVLPGGRHIVSVSVGGTKGVDESVPKTPFEWDFLYSDAVVVQAGSAEMPREGTIRGAVRGALPVCGGQDMIWTYRLSADYRVADPELEIHIKGSTAPGTAADTACKLLSW